MIFLTLIFTTTGCSNQSIAVGVEDEALDHSSVPALDPQSQLQLPCSYSGYIGSLATGESHYDIGANLSEIQFDLTNENTALVHYKIDETQVVDSQGIIEADYFSKTGDYVEMTYTHDTLGKVRLIGTMKETSFTGKIYFDWHGHEASMNFITILNGSTINE